MFQKLTFGEKKHFENENFLNKNILKLNKR